MDGGVRFRFKNRMIGKALSEPSREEFIELIKAQAAENAELEPYDIRPVQPALMK